MSSFSSFVSLLGEIIPIVLYNSNCRSNIPAVDKSDVGNLLESGFVDLGRDEEVRACEPGSCKVELRLNVLFSSLCSA